MNCIEFSDDSEVMLIGGGAEKGCFFAASNSSVKGNKVSVLFLEDQKNAVPTVLNRFSGQDVFLLGVAGNVYVFKLHKNLKIEQIHRYGNVCEGILTDICIKGNMAFCKGNKEKDIKILVFNYQGSKPCKSEFPQYNANIIRPYMLRTSTNLEKISYSGPSIWIYAGGTLGLTALKEDPLTKEYVQVASQVVPQ